MKGSKSAFILFCDDERESLRAYHPKWTFGEVAKELGSMWRKLKGDKKEIYLERSHLLRSQHSLDGDKKIKSNKRKGAMVEKKGRTKKQRREGESVDPMAIALVEKVMRESIPIVLAGVPQDRVASVSSHFHAFQANVKEALCILHVPKKTVNGVNINRLNGTNKDMETTLISLQKSCTHLDNAARESANMLEGEKQAYMELVERLNKLEERSNAKSHPLLCISKEGEAKTNQWPVGKLKCVDMYVPASSELGSYSLSINTLPMVTSVLSATHAITSHT